MANFINSWPTWGAGPTVRVWGLLSAEQICPGTVRQPASLCSMAELQRQDKRKKKEWQRLRRIPKTLWREKWEKETPTHPYTHTSSMNLAVRKGQQCQIYWVVWLQTFGFKLSSFTNLNASGENKTHRGRSSFNLNIERQMFLVVNKQQQTEQRVLMKAGSALIHLYTKALHSSVSNILKGKWVMCLRVKLKL